MTLLTTVIWWTALLSAWYVAGVKGRNRFAWTAATAFVPLVVLVLFALRPRVA